MAEACAVKELVLLKQAGIGGRFKGGQNHGREIPEVKSAVAGPADGTGGPFCDPGWDVCFILSFEDEAARQRYNAHPVHEKAAREVFLPLSEKLLFYRFVSE